MQTPKIIGMVFFFALTTSAWACDPEGNGGDDPGKERNLAGDEVTERSDFEEVLGLVLHKRRTEHFVFETSRGGDACGDFIDFCETSHNEFLRWAGKPPETRLWDTRARIAILDKKEAWERLVRHWTRGEPPRIVEAVKCVGGAWKATPPTVILYSREGEDLDDDKAHIFHFINHLFLAGLAGSGNGGVIWWLYEAFSTHRCIEAFGLRTSGCKVWETDDRWNSAAHRAWYRLDDWVTLLKQDVSSGNDMAFRQMITRGNFRDDPPKTIVKAWSLIRWFVRDEKEKSRFVDFLSALKTKDDQVRALERVYAMSPEDVDRSWADWILEQPSRWRR